MLEVLKGISLILVIFLSSGCSQKQHKVRIPKILTDEVKAPTPPKIKAKVHKQIAIFLIQQDEAVQKCNLKLKLLRELYP